MKRFYARMNDAVLGTVTRMEKKRERFWKCLGVASPHSQQEAEGRQQPG